MKKHDVEKSYYVAYLLGGFLNNKLSINEKEELNNWINKSVNNRQLFDEISVSGSLEKQLHQFETADAVAGWERLQQEIVKLSTKRKRKITITTWWQSVAAALVLCLTAWQLFERREIHPETIPILESRFGEDLHPGTKKATLLLNNGTAVHLGINVDSLFTENGIRVQNAENGWLNYKPSGSTVASASNTLQVPMGGEYTLQLEDGTKVWLNAASSLRYPVQFGNHERRVELLKGEAYFEVAKNNKKPFIVIANDIHIQAIGTAFNVNTYKAGAHAATLTEGIIKVVTKSGIDVLKPGDQLSVSGDSTNVSNIDIESVTGWKNGLFIFNNTPFQDVMSQLARWYDVSIQYDQEFTAQKYFTGEIKRSVPVSKLLEMMELTGIARFRIKAGKILVLPYKT